MRTKQSTLGLTMIGLLTLFILIVSLTQYIMLGSVREINSVLVTHENDLQPARQYRIHKQLDKLDKLDGRQQQQQLTEN
jgi:hypothetical protein